MDRDQKVLTQEEFLETVRAAFAFLARFGFGEVTAPPGRGTDQFEVWFQADKRFIVVKGEGYGTAASVTLEHSDGLELADVFLTGRDDSVHRKDHRGQLEQIGEAARRLEDRAEDFLRGDLKRFFAWAKPLPPYKRPTL